MEYDRPASGTWVGGTIYGHRFEALVFQEHAVNPEWELGDSGISKLWLQRMSDRRNAFNWDRGLDVPPTNRVVEAIIEFLKTRLAAVVFGSPE